MNKESSIRIWMIEARHKKGITQEELGKICGVSSNAINQYERNKRFPKPDILIKICKELNLDIKQFYENE